jgi:hypothetical protein
MASSKDQETTGVGLPTAAGATLALWFILLAFGGGCLAWYNSSIRYFPDIAWEEALSFLGVLSIIGGSLTVVFSLLAFLPGAMWSEMLIEDCQLRCPLHYRRTDDKLEPCLLSIAWIIGVPFAFFILSMHILLAFAGTLMRVLGTLLFLLLATMLFMWQISKALKKWSEIHAGEVPPVRQRNHDNHSAPSPLTEKDSCEGMRASSVTKNPLQSSKAKYIVAFVASDLLGLAALLILERLFGVDYSQPRAFGLALFCAAVVVAANIFVSSLFGTRRLVAIVAAGLATILLLVVAEWIRGPASVLQKVMESYGVGESTRYALIVTKEGSELLAAQGLQVEVGDEGKWGRLRDIAILSRLGDNFFLCSHRKRVSLPRWMVLSWSADSSKPGPKVAPSCDPHLP